MNDTFGTLFNAVDVVALVYFVFAAAMGFKRGLSGELTRLVGASATIIITLKYFSQLSDVFTQHTRLAEHPETARPLAFILIAVCVGLCFFVLRILLAYVMKVSFNPKIDRVCGILAGCARATIIVAVIVLALGLCPSQFLRRVFREQSAFGRVLFTHAPTLVERAQNFLHVSPPAKKAEPQTNSASP